MAASDEFEVGLAGFVASPVVRRSVAVAPLYVRTRRKREGGKRLVDGGHSEQHTTSDCTSALNLHYQFISHSRILTGTPLFMTEASRRVRCWPVADARVAGPGVCNLIKFVRGTFE
jgi:hypothetical protein